MGPEVSSIGPANLLAGRPSPSVGGGRLAVREARAPFAELGSWPTSGPLDVERALDAIAAAAKEGAPAFEPVELRACFERAARTIAADAEAADLLARRIGMERSALHPHVARLEDGLDIPVARAEGAAGTGRVALIAPDWSDLYELPWRVAAEELCRGRSLLLAADPRVPVLAERLAAAWLEGGVPAERVSVLHGLSGDGLAAAVADPRVDAVHASGARARIRWLRELCVRAGTAVQDLRLLRSEACEVGLHDDLEGAARRVIDLAFGESRSLFGQRRGQVSRVYCAARVFSRFTEALLGEFEREGKERDGGAKGGEVPMIDRAAAEAVRRHWAIGLDEGATLIAGGRSAAGERLASCHLSPAIFTNLEPHMIALQRQAPMPILGLVRA